MAIGLVWTSKCFKWEYLDTIIFFQLHKLATLEAHSASHCRIFSLSEPNHIKNVLHCVATMRKTSPNQSTSGLWGPANFFVQSDDLNFSVLKTFARWIQDQRVLPNLHNMLLQLSTSFHNCAMADPALQKASRLLSLTVRFGTNVVWSKVMGSKRHGSIWLDSA